MIASSARSRFYVPLSTYLSFSSTALTNKNVYFAHQGSKLATKQNVICDIHCNNY